MTDIKSVNTTELTDRQVLEEVRLIYIRRKNQDRMYSMRRLAAEIPIGEAVLYRALIRKDASPNTIAVLRGFLEIKKETV
jgi:hypothetical protein